MKPTEKELYDKVMGELQDAWMGDRNTFIELYRESEGIRSSQVAALVLLLIRKGILGKE